MCVLLFVFFFRVMVLLSIVLDFGLMLCILCLIGCVNVFSFLMLVRIEVMVFVVFFVSSFDLFVEGIVLRCRINMDLSEFGIFVGLVLCMVSVVSKIDVVVVSVSFIGSLSFVDFDEGIVVVFFDLFFGFIMLDGDLEGEWLIVVMSW